MPRIPQYQQGQLASSQVGTPGLDRSANILAGATEQSLQSAAGTSLAIENANQNFVDKRTMQNRAVQMGILNDVNTQVQQQRAFNAAVARHEQTLIADAEIATEGYAYQDKLKSTFDEYTAKFADDPTQFEPAIQQWIKDSNQDLEDIPSAVKRARVTAQRASYNNSALEASRNWALQRQTQQVHELPKKVTNHIADSLSGLDREQPFDQRLQVWKDKLRDGEGALNGYRTSLGNPIIDSETTDMRAATSNVVLANSILRRPEKPTDALSYLQGVRQAIEKPHEYGLQLTENDQKTLASQLKSAEDDEQLRLVAHDTHDQIGVRNIATDLKIAAEAAPEADLEKIDSTASAQIANLDKQYSDVDNRSTLSEKAKKTLLDGIVARKADFLAVKSAVNTQQKYYATLRSQEASAQQNTNTVARAVLAPQITAAKAEEVAAKHTATITAQTEINAMLEKLSQMKVGAPSEVSSRRAQIVQLAAEISTRSQAMSTIEKTMLPAQAHSISKQMEDTLKQVALLHDVAPSLTNWMGGTQPYKTAVPTKPDPVREAWDRVVMHHEPEYVEARKAQAQILNEWKDARGKMHLEKTYADLTADTGFTAQQRIRWNEGVTNLQARKNPDGSPLDPIQFEAGLQKWHAIVAGKQHSQVLQEQMAALQDIRVQSAASKLSKAQANAAPKNGLVPPPPALPPTGAAMSSDLPDYIVEQAIAQAKRQGKIK